MIMVDGKRRGGSYLLMNAHLCSDDNTGILNYSIGMSLLDLSSDEGIATYTTSV